MCPVTVKLSSVSVETGILLSTTECKYLELNATGHCGCDDSINRLKRY